MLAYYIMHVSTTVYVCMRLLQLFFAFLQLTSVHPIYFHFMYICISSRASYGKQMLIYSPRALFQWYS